MSEERKEKNTSTKRRTLKALRHRAFASIGVFGNFTMAFASRTRAGAGAGADADTDVIQNRLQYRMVCEKAVLSGPYTPCIEDWGC